MLTMAMNPKLRSIRGEMDQIQGALAPQFPDGAPNSSLDLLRRSVHMLAGNVSDLAKLVDELAAQID